MRAAQATTRAATQEVAAEAAAQLAEAEARAGREADVAVGSTDRINSIFS